MKPRQTGEASIKFSLQIMKPRQTGEAIEIDLAQTFKMKSAPLPAEIKNKSAIYKLIQVYFDTFQIILNKLGIGYKR